VVDAPIDTSVAVGMLKADSVVPNNIVDSLEKILLDDGDTVESICGISVDSEAWVKLGCSSVKMEEIVVSNGSLLVNKSDDGVGATLELKSLNRKDTSV
jgi:hypothetical protein